MTETKAAAPPAMARRSDALDALRGLAILAMVFAAVIPFGEGPHGMLPAWMYHAQTPPPTHAFNPDIPGITWVDLVFPFFLFSMGAAIPLALGRRLEKGASVFAIVGGILWRGALLAFFAFYRAHVGPYDMAENPGRATWLLAIGAMGLLWLVWGRFPARWNVAAVRGLRAAGWIGMLALLALVGPPDGARLAPSLSTLRQWVGRVDIIILVLANVYVFGALIWLATRGSWAMRLGVAVALAGLKLSSASPGWTQTVWNWSPAPWLTSMGLLKYLMIILPATVVGDVLWRWLEAPAEDSGAAAAWSAGRTALLAGVSFAFVPLMLVGLQTRRVGEMILAALLLGAAGFRISRRPGNERERLLARLYAWGVAGLALGLCFEPLEGGIHKDPATISYMLIPPGLAVLLLLSLMIVTDTVSGRRAARLLTDNGQNALLAYMGMGNFIIPAMALLGVEAWLAAHPLTLWQGVLKGALMTLALALCVSLCTRRKVFVRA